MKKYYLILLFSFSLIASVVAQATLTGKVTDAATGEELISATVVVTQNGNFIKGQSTDFDGNFSIIVDPEIYDLEISYTGYQPLMITDIQAIEGNATKIDVQLKTGIIIRIGCGGWSYAIPLIEQDNNTQGIKFKSEKIKNQPTRDIKEMSILTPGVSFIK